LTKISAPSADMYAAIHPLRQWH